jgi:hypothetical protein
MTYKNILIKFIFIISLFVFIGTSNASASCYVDGYYKSNGTYVNGYYRSCPNETVKDNYSYYGNSNPYTGSTGSNRYSDDDSSDYYGGGSRGLLR